jgi:hypothetical protein
MADVRFDSGPWLAQFSSGDAAQISRVLLATAPVNSPPPGVEGLELIRHLTQDPAYQLR